MTKEILLKALELMAKDLVNCPLGDCVIPARKCGGKECIRAIVYKYICMAMEAK